LGSPIILHTRSGGLNLSLTKFFQHEWPQGNQ
jgi:hypothetical protein